MKRFLKKTLALLVIPSLMLSTTHALAATESTNKTPNISATERTKIETVVHQYLLNNPEILVQALQKFQHKQYEQADKTIKQTQLDAPKFANALFHQSTDPVAGNPNGKITVVEFFDYQCPHCIDMAPVVDAIISANPDVRVVFKEFPIRGPASELAARAALAAQQQGKYKELQHAMLTSKQPLTEDSIFKMATKLGLNVNKLKADMHDSKVNNQLKANMQLAQTLKLFGTPAFFIAKTDITNNNGSVRYIPGRMNQKQMQTEIDKISK